MCVFRCSYDVVLLKVLMDEVIEVMRFILVCVCECDHQVFTDSDHH